VQQICWSQSLLCWHDLGQVAEQMPLQQSWFVVEQSESVAHAFGHGAYCGFRQSPGAVMLGSTLLAVVQQTSPFVVLQVELELQGLGHSLAAVHRPLL
jgi:hypothetical protein